MELRRLTPVIRANRETLLRQLDRSVFPALRTRLDPGYGEASSPPLEPMRDAQDEIPPGTGPANVLPPAAATPAWMHDAAALPHVLFTQRPNRLRWQIDWY